MANGNNQQPLPSGRGYIERALLIQAASLATGGSLNTFSKEFPMGEGWYRMNIRINIALTIGTGTGAIAEGELLFVKNIQLKTDRGELICNLPGRALYKIATARTGQAPRKDAIAAATATYRVNVPILFSDIDMLRPEDTILDTSRYNSVTLQVTMGTVSDLLTTVGTSSVTATMDVEVERSLGRLPPAARPLYHISYDFRPPVDANTTTSIDLERSADMAVKRFYVHSSSGGTAGVAWGGANADDVQNVVNLKDQNRFIEKDRIHAMIQDANKQDYLLETALAGVEIFDFVRDRSIASALSTAEKSVLQYTWTNQSGVAANDIVTVAAEMLRTLK